MAIVNASPQIDYAVITLQQTTTAQNTGAWTIILQETIDSPSQSRNAFITGNLQQLSCGSHIAGLLVFREILKKNLRDLNNKIQIQLPPSGGHWSVERTNNAQTTTTDNASTITTGIVLSNKS